jgi:hypothetical protein
MHTGHGAAKLRPPDFWHLPNALLREMQTGIFFARNHAWADKTFIFMKTVTCGHCGVPFKTRGGGRDSRTPGRYFCCTGCAMLARVPVDEEGRFPVNAQLVSLLATGFLYFNQLLFWLLAALLAMQGKGALSARFYWASAAAAAGVWGAVAVLQWRERVARKADVIALAFGVCAWMLAIAPNGGSATAVPPAWPMAAANTALIAWNMRGILRGRKKQGHT